MTAPHEYSEEEIIQSYAKRYLTSDEPTDDLILALAQFSISTCLAE